MSAPFDHPEEERRSFASRTPVNDNPDRVEYRRGFVTKHQVSGWRFLVRRIAAGLALHDTRMLVEPLRAQSRAVLMGAVLLVAGLAGCFVLSLIRPGGSAGNDVILSDRATSALYVRVGEQLHPVLNLTSARLIAGRPANPTAVKTAVLDSFPRGNLLGIPGAPERTVQSTETDAEWTVCDAASGSAVGVTVIAGPLDSSGSRAAALGAERAVLADNGSGTWLLWDGKRSRIDLADRAITAALGLDAGAVKPRPIASGLFNAIPEAPALVPPAIPEAGVPPRYGLPEPVPVGGVVVAHEIGDNSDAVRQYYAVLEDGLQPISGVLAAVLRNTDSHGLERPPVLGADDIARLPVSRQLDVSRFPDKPLHVVDGVSAPVTCAQWSKPAGASTSSLTLLSGSTLPLREGVRHAGSGGRRSGRHGRPRRPDTRPGLLRPERQQDPRPIEAGGTAVLDLRHRCAVRPQHRRRRAGGDGADTVSALGLSEPVLPLPWSVLSQFARDRLCRVLMRCWLMTGCRRIRVRVVVWLVSWVVVSNVGESR